MVYVFILEHGTASTIHSGQAEPTSLHYQPGLSAWHAEVPCHHMEWRWTRLQPRDDHAVHHVRATLHGLRHDQPGCHCPSEAVSERSVYADNESPPDAWHP